MCSSASASFACQRSMAARHLSRSRMATAMFWYQSAALVASSMVLIFRGIPFLRLVGLHKTHAGRTDTTHRRLLVWAQRVGTDVGCSRCHDREVHRLRDKAGAGLLQQPARRT